MAQRERPRILFVPCAWQRSGEIETVIIKQVTKGAREDDDDDGVQTDTKAVSVFGGRMEMV